jgi:hypothetical protein
MSKTWSRRPSPALIVAFLALIVAMAGTSYAATKLAKNSVGTNQLKKNAVTGAKVKDGSLTGSDIDIASLGNVPSASNADRANLADRALTADSVGTAKTAQNADHATTAGHATTADSASEADHATIATSAETIPQAGPIHVVGATGEPPFLDGSTNRATAPGGPVYQSVGFYKDAQGIVHLEGVVEPGSSGSPEGLLFQLPVGYRPAAGKFVAFEPAEKRGLLIGGTGAAFGGNEYSGMVVAADTSAGAIPLSGVTFLAQG